MKPERILKVAAQVVALALLATSSPLAQKAAEPPAPKKAKAVASRVAHPSKNGSTNPTPEGTPVARLRAVEGNVLLSQESGLSSVEGPVPLVEGARVITTADSKAVVVFNDGCEVMLESNQRLEIESDVPCRERILLAQSIFLPGGFALGAAAGGAAAGGAAAAGGVAGGVAGGAAASSATAAVLGGSLPSVGLAAGASGLAGFAALVDTRESSPASPN